MRRSALVLALLILVSAAAAEAQTTNRMDAGKIATEAAAYRDAR